MKKVSQVLGFLFAAALLASCGVGGSATSGSSAYSYDFTDQGCSTGRHEFNSHSDMCEGLQSSSLNNGAWCAFNARSQYFKSEGCSGFFTPTFVR